MQFEKTISKVKGHSTSEMQFDKPFRYDKTICQNDTPF